MPLSHVSYNYGIVDAKISKLTADPTGGTATYATSVDVPGIKSIEISGSVDVKQLRGDNTLLAQLSTLQDITASVEHARLSLDIMPILTGGTTADTGTTPNQVATFGLTSASQMNYFKIEGKAAGSDFVGGDVHIVLYKCVLTSFPDLGFSEEDFRTASFDIGCSPLNATGNKILDVVFNETLAAIA